MWVSPCALCSSPLVKRVPLEQQRNAPHSCYQARFGAKENALPQTVIPHSLTSRPAIGGCSTHLMRSIFRKHSCASHPSASLTCNPTSSCVFSALPTPHLMRSMRGKRSE